MTLREFRQNAGLTLEQMGKLLDRHFTTIHKWELGVQVPTAISVAQIERVTRNKVRAASFTRRPVDPSKPLPPSHRAQREERERRRCRENV